MSIIKDRLTSKKNKQLEKDLKKIRIKVLNNAGYDNEEISRIVGLSESTVRLILKSQIEESE